MATKNYSVTPCKVGRERTVGTERIWVEFNITLDSSNGGIQALREASLLTIQFLDEEEKTLLGSPHQAQHIEASVPPDVKNSSSIEKNVTTSVPRQEGNDQTSLRKNQKVNQFVIVDDVEIPLPELTISLNEGERARFDITEANKILREKGYQFNSSIKDTVTFLWLNNIGTQKGWFIGRLSDKEGTRGKFFWQKDPKLLVEPLRLFKDLPDLIHLVKE